MLNLEFRYGDFSELRVSEKTSTLWEKVSQQTETKPYPRPNLVATDP
jgi:hypothetical protein